MTTEVSIKPQKVYYYPFSFSSNSSRSFNCNAITFINSGTSNVFLNDIFLLVPNAQISFNGGQNEIDYTIYKIVFALGGTNLLQGFTKENAGQRTFENYPKDAFYTLNESKRVQDAKRNGREARKGEKNNKVGAKDKGDF